MTSVTLKCSILRKTACSQTQRSVNRQRVIQDETTCIFKCTLKLRGLTILNMGKSFILCYLKKIETQDISDPPITQNSSSLPLYSFCLCAKINTPCVSVCMWESDSPRVSYSSTKVSFPFLLHTSPLCYFRAMLAELVVSRGSLSHTHSNSEQHVKSTGSVLGEGVGAVHLFMVQWLIWWS